MTLTADPCPIPERPEEPPAADIPGAIARTKHALLMLTDADSFEEIAVVCLQEFIPSLRRCGGPGDEQRDGVAGSLRPDKDETIVTASLRRDWRVKVRSDLDGIDAHKHNPKLVVAVTNRKVAPKTATALERETRSSRGYRLRVIDVGFLALRLLTPELLAAREELLGLPLPLFPVAVIPEEFARRQPNFGAPGELIGRSDELDQLVSLVQEHTHVDVVGAGGIGKTRLVLEATKRAQTGRTLVLDHGTRLDSDVLASELAGADRLVLVIDNAHRRDDLGQIVTLLSARNGPASLIFTSRPGFDERLRQATEGTRFGGPNARATLALKPLSGESIGQLVRAATPELMLEGAIEQIVSLAEGNPLIALIAHQVAARDGTVIGRGLNVVLEQYAQSAVAAVIGRRLDVSADDFRDILAVVAALGTIDTPDEDLLQSVLGLSRRELRHRLTDLEDSGVLQASGDRRAISPDLLSAYLLHEAFFSERGQSGVGYDELWQTAGDDRHDAMCSAIGTLAGFVIADSAKAPEVVRDALRKRAAAEPRRALNQALSIAPGLPSIAAEIVDISLSGLADPPEALLMIATNVLSRVPDISKGWDRQLAVARLFFAKERSGDAVKRMKEALSTVYQRLPVNVSVYDGQILAHVQDVLNETTSRYWQQHRSEPGCARAIAVAAGQLLTVMSERSYMSPELTMTIKMTAGFLPGSERTAAVLRAGLSLLRQALPGLELADQREAIDPLGRLAHTAGGFPGPFSTTPGQDLVALAAEIIAEAATEFASDRNLPLPARARIREALRQDPWPDDAEFQSFCALLAPGLGHDLDDEWGGPRAERQARTLLAAEDPNHELQRWQTWLALANVSGMRHLSHGVIDVALSRAAEQQPDTMVRALAETIPGAPDLAIYSARALATLFSYGNHELAQILLTDASPVTKAAVAAGLAGSKDEWADALLAGLAEDPDRAVRSAVASAAGWTDAPSVDRLVTGLQACLPADVQAALAMLRRAAGRLTELLLDDRAVALLDEIVAGAARQDRLDARGLIKLSGLTSNDQILLSVCLARVRWLRSHPAARIEDQFARDSLPDELAAALPPLTDEATVIELADLVEDESAGSEARFAAILLLAGAAETPRLTERLWAWLTSDDDQLAYQAGELLRHTRGPDRFKRRVAALLEAHPELDLTTIAYQARSPWFFTGSARLVYLQIAAEFAAWAEDPDERLVRLGIEVAHRFIALAKAETDETDLEDNEVSWG